MQVHTNSHPLTVQIKLIDFSSLCLTQCMFHIEPYRGNRRLISMEQATICQSREGTFLRLLWGKRAILTEGVPAA